MVVDPYTGEQVGGKKNISGTSNTVAEVLIDVPASQKDIYFISVIIAYLAALCLSSIINLSLVFALVKGRKIFAQVKFILR